ncbi:MAG: hypothetical protein KTR31_07880 [Myxococcales bacterium]|nr:hypothetical protein [Myxococcales bacterium]
MSPDVGPAIGAFWSWWEDNRPVLDAEVGSTADLSFVAELSARIDAIHPNLEWEFGKGVVAQHQFCVSATGDPKLRVLAERWKAAGPPADEVFEYHTARQRIPGDVSGTALGFGPHTVSFDDFRFAIEEDDGRQRLNVIVHHPAFAALDEDGRARVMFVSLDNVLGEDAVETWLGSLGTSAEEAPDDAIGVMALRQLLDALPSRWEQPSWAAFSGVDDELPVVLLACTSAKYLLEPLFDTLCLVSIPYQAGQTGMPDNEVVTDALAEFDARLDEELSETVRMLARQTGGGVRRLWCYTRSANGPGRQGLERLCQGFTGASVHVSWDPGWRDLPV